MIKRTYDLVYLTNTPSFYKLNLCEAIAANGVRVLLVLYGYGSEAVNTQLGDRSKWKFDYEFINDGDANRRSKLSTFVRLLKLMYRVNARRVIYSGWLAPEYNLYSFLSAKEKNAVVCESSIMDVSLSGMKGWLKRRIIGRMSAALPSGEPHKQLFDSIGFKGECYITGSVGLFNKSNRQPKVVHSPLRYIYVGRLIDVKNVAFLIDVFNRNGLPLTIVGAGILEYDLKSKAKSNINFTGFIANDALGDVYREHDIFILPSKSETWGLVVEEALFRGLPVIASSRVGAATDMVKNLSTGEIFQSGDAGSLQMAIDKVSADYDKYHRMVEAIDWEARDRAQVESYIKLLK